MNKFLILGICVINLIGVQLVCSMEKNLIPNPSFEEVSEEGMLIGWPYYMKDDFPAVSVTNEYSHSGKRCVVFDASKKNIDWMRMACELPKSLLGRKVKISVWVYHSDANSSIQFRLRQYREKEFLGDAVNIKSNSLAKNFESKKWIKVSGEGTVRSESTYIEMFIVSPNTNVPGVLEVGPLYIDDISLSVVEGSTEENSIPKLSFEQPFNHLGDCLPRGFPKLPSISSGSTEVKFGRQNPGLKNNRKTDFIVFQKHYMELISRDYIPSEDETEQKVHLEIIASPEEYEPVTFSIYAFRKDMRYRIKIEDLQNEEGGSFGNENFDIRVLTYYTLPMSVDKYKTVPKALEKYDTYTIPKDNTQTVWITAYIPRGTPKGIYRGKVVLDLEDGEKYYLPLKLTVLPINLVVPDTKFGMYCYAGLQTEYLHDMVAHGMNWVVPFFIFPVPTLDEQGKVKVDINTLKNFLKNYKASGMKGEISFLLRNLNTFWNKMKIEKGEVEAEILYKEGIKKLLDCIREENIPLSRINWIPEEEAANERARLLDCVTAKFLKEMGLRTELIVNGPWVGIDEAEIYDTWIDIRTYNYIDETIIERTRKAGDELRIYNMAKCAGINWPIPPTIRTRLSYGFYGIRIEAKGVCQWIYCSGGGYISKNGEYDGYVFLTSKNPIPTPYWEILREGIDDAKYYATLERIIQEKKKDREKAKELENASQLLDRIKEQIPIDIGEYGKITNTMDGLIVDTWRKEIIRQILILEGYPPEKFGLDSVPADITILSKVPVSYTKVKDTRADDMLYPTDSKEIKQNYRKSLVIPKTSKPPELDGILNDPCWEKAATGFTVLTGSASEPKAKTKFFVTYDNKNIYVAFQCDEPMMEKIVNLTKERDDFFAWQDDCVGIYLDTNRDEKSYLHFIVTCGNKQLDLKRGITSVREEREWSATWYSATSIGERSWYVEIAIPFSSIEIAPIEEGTSWNANFCRERQPIKENSSWSFVREHFAAPRWFGHLYFSGGF